MLAWSLALALAVAHADEPRTNVLLVTVDCMRPDHMGVYGYDRDTTPYLSRLAAESVVFEQAYATSAWTSPGVVSLLTGYWPPTHGQNGGHSFWDPLLPTPLTLLGKQGYSMVGRTHEGATIEHLGFKQGLTPYADLEELITVREKYSEKPFFAWVHLKEPHLPYAASAYSQRRWGGDARSNPAIEAVKTQGVVFRHKSDFTYAPEDVPVVRALYDGGVAAADDRLGRAIERLRADGLLKRTLLIITADHGEELLEHGWVGHASTSWDGKLYDENMHIPLIVRVPDASLTGRVSATVQQLDVMPTIVDLLGLDVSSLPLPMQGRSLVPLMKGEAGPDREYAFAQTTTKGWTTPKEEMRTRITAVRSDTAKVIRWGDGRMDAFDLVADPGEQHPLDGDWETTLAPLLAALADWDASTSDDAATLVLAAARAHLEAAQAAAKAGDDRGVVEHYGAILDLEHTWGMEARPFFEQPAHAAAWKEVVRAAAKVAARSVDGRARGR